MESQKSPSKNSTHTAKGMYEFFHEEFQSLRAKTGIRQWEQLNEQPDSARIIHEHIDFMCKECEKPPFHVVRPEVKQRVIARAIVEDGDFIGLNAKFVRKALNAFWIANGDRVMEAINQKERSVYDKIELTDEQKRKIDSLANAYVAQLLQGDGPKMVPKMESNVAAIEGQEWKSNLERKAISYPPNSEEQIQAHELHLEWARRNFDTRTGDKLPTWKPEPEWMEGLTEDDKKRIYKKAGI